MTASEQQPGALERDAPRSAQIRRSDYPYARIRGPFALMDRLFDQFFGRDLFGRDLFGRDLFSLAFGQQADTVDFPQIEVAQQADKIEVRADLPGLKKDDVKVELRDRDLVISGERRSEQERREATYYRSERSYGSFCRTIRLPDNAKLDSIDAAFENGVLKIQIDVPGMEQKQARPVEVRDATESKDVETRH